MNSWSQQGQLWETHVYKNPTRQKLKLRHFLQTTHLQERRWFLLPGQFVEARRTRGDSWSSAESDVELDDWLLTDGLLASNALSLTPSAQSDPDFPCWTAASSLQPNNALNALTRRRQQCAWLQYFQLKKEVMKSYKNYSGYFDMSRSRMSPSSGRWCVSVTDWHRA